VTRTSNLYLTFRFDGNKQCITEDTDVKYGTEIYHKHKHI